MKIPIKPINARWTDEQWLAIYATGTNILVSAGAGSGKTAVLTERIIQKLKSGVKLSSLIVLTFTKAAANEMKSRIRNELAKAIKEGYPLEEEFAYIDQASIQTFDAFSLSLVRKYHYKLNLPKHITIGDKVVLEKTQIEILDQIFEEYYQNPTKEFINFLSTYALKDDQEIKKYILSMCSKLQLVIDVDGYLETFSQRFFNEEFIKERIKEYLDLFKAYKDKIKLRLEKLAATISDDVLCNHLEELKNSLSPLFSATSFYDYIQCQNLKRSIPRTPSNGDSEEKNILKKEKDLIKKDLETLSGLVKYDSEEQMLDEILQTKPICMLLIDIIKKFMTRYNQFKHQNHLYEFMDIAKLGIKLLKENDDLREYIKLNTHEILIDEYQDTSDIQEEFISLISNNNVYMVGDIKQSIYRFRNANPNLFKEKYLRFLQNDGGIVIDLSKNFRSRKEVITGVNLIFSKIMTEDLGSINYDKRQELQFGNIKYLDYQVNPSYEMTLLTYDYDLVKDDYKEYEVEAFIIANDIKQKIDCNYQVVDKDGIRPCRYSDFTILTSTKTHFDVYKRIFQYLQIPLAIHKEDPFVLSDEIYIIKNILICINSFYTKQFDDSFKLSLMSILRSFVYRVEDKIITKVISGDIYTNLKQELPEIFNILQNLANLSNQIPLFELIDKIYQEFNIYEKLVLIGNVDLLEDKLNFFYEKTIELSKIGYNLENLSDYFEWIIDQGTDIEFLRETQVDANVVNMMSIHKSKGLEFPICYFPDLSTKFNFQDLNERFIFDANLGIVSSIFKEGITDTFYKEILKHRYLVDEISERLRLFYVALTRAKEQIILVMPNYQELNMEYGKVVPFVDRINYNSFRDIVNSINYVLDNFSKQVNLNNLNITPDYVIMKSSTFENIPLINKPITYRNVSLVKQPLQTTTATKHHPKLMSVEQQQNIALGNMFHEYLEIIDIFKPLDEQLDLIDNNIIKEYLWSFYQHPFIKNLNIINTYHEYPFKYNEYEQEVHGIIDLIIETKDELIIIDYKLLNLENVNYYEQLLTYKNYLTKVSTKKISAYLYSILKKEFYKVL